MLFNYMFLYNISTVLWFTGRRGRRPLQSAKIDARE